MHSNTAEERDGEDDDDDDVLSCDDDEEEDWQHQEYFGQYGEIPIHQAMLSDRVRCETYRRAVESFADVDFEGKVVMDLGCGTGLLSCFCARAGAARVYAVEASSMAMIAQSVARTNHLDHIITVVHDRIEDALLPEKVDVIISEWMGCFLLFEGMLDSVLYARDRYLKEGGKLYPDRAIMYLAPISYQSYYQKHVGFLQDVEGLNLNVLRRRAEDTFLSSCLKSHMELSADDLLSEPQELASYDLTTATLEQIHSGLLQFSFEPRREADFHGFAVWFNVEFSSWPYKKERTLSKAPSGVSSAAQPSKAPCRTTAQSRQCSTTTEPSVATEPSVTTDPSRSTDPGEQKRRERCVTLYTGPEHPVTHWGQDLFFLLDKLSLRGRHLSPENTLEGCFAFRQNPEYPRRYIVEVECSSDQLFALQKTFVL